MRSGLPGSRWNLNLNPVPALPLASLTPLAKLHSVRADEPPDMASPTFEQRRSEQRAQVRRAVLDATEALLLEEGEERFSIRRLVERCGYTAPTIYHHFGDKTGLIDTLLNERFDRLARQLKRVPRGDDPVQYLRAMALTLVRFSLRNPTHHRLLYAPRAQQHAPPR